MRIAVVGAGPAGFYTAQALLRRHKNVYVDLIEQLPVPFGLVRYGVAPDHSSTKNVISTFSNFMEANSSRVRFLGNVPVLQPNTLSHDELSQFYDYTVVATGAARPRTLDIRIPDHGVYSAHDFVQWVNGHPYAHADDRLCGMGKSMSQILKKSNDVVVVGMGNVGIDIARLLLKPVDELRGTDISPQALDIIESAQVRNVTLVGRRAPRHAAWTTAALRELLTKVPEVKSQCDHALVERDAQMPNVSRAVNRMLKVLRDSTTCLDSGSVHGRALRSAKQLQLQFLREPKLIERSRGWTNIHFAVNEVVEDRERQPDGSTSTTSQVSRTKETVFQSCDLSFLSLGYEGGSGQGIRVGWANGHGKGIIAESKWDAESVVATMESSLIKSDTVDSDVHCKEGLDVWLREHNWEVVTWDGWKRIDAEERARGETIGFGRERAKLESVSEMLQVARGPSPAFLNTSPQHTMANAR